MYMPRLEILLLGANQIRLNGQVISNVGGDKPLALLFYLAVENNRPHRREFLAGMFWPDQSPDKALHNLRQALTTLRKAIRDEEATVPHLFIQRDTIQFNPASDYWLDIEEFSKLSDEALEFYRPTQLNRIRLSKLEKMVALYKGNFLDQFFLADSSIFEEWAILTRESLSRRIIQCMQILIEVYYHRDESHQAIRMAENLVKIASWDEEHYRILMRLLAQDGRWSEAQSVYQTCVRYLATSLDSEPSHETVLLQDQITSYARGKKVFAKPSHPPQNLPSLTTKFIGREKEKEEISNLLADPACRLLTIHGMGGVGKTRLAIETARSQVGLYSDGVWYFSLEALETKDQLVAALLAMFHVSLPSGTDPENVLFDYLQNKNLLLILDSYEHIGGDPDVVLGILANAPKVTLLITTRLILSIQPEWVYPLKGLSIYQEAAANESGAVQLFVQRALQKGYPILLDNPTYQAIKEICSLVDGLPLGIELASTTLKGSTCQQVLEDIQQTFGALQTTHRDVHERHRSLQAAFEYSWKHLPHHLQIVLSNLSVFRGGFYTQDVKGVFSVETVDLQTLVDHSLLQLTSQGRFTIHDVIRQFSEEKLKSEPDMAEAAYTNYANWFTGVMENAAPNLLSVKEQEVIEDLKQQLPNLLQTIKILLNGHAEDGLLRSADCLYHFYQTLGRFNEGVALFKDILNVMENPSDRFLLTFHNRLGGLQIYGRLGQDAIKNLKECYSTAVNLDDHFEIGFNLSMQSTYYHRKGDQVLALEKATQALNEFTLCGNGWGHSLVQYLLGKIYQHIGQIQDSKEWYNRSLKTAQSIGHPHSQLRVLNALGDLVCQLNELDEGLILFTKCLEISRALDDRYNQAMQINNIGTIYHLKGNLSDAQKSYSSSLELCRDIGDRAGEAIALSNLGEISLVQNELKEAEDRFQEALQISHTIEDNYNIMVCETNLGETYLKMNDLKSCSSLLSNAFSLSIENEDRTQMSKILVLLARLAVELKKNDLAYVLCNWIKEQEFSAAETITRANELLAHLDPIALQKAYTIEDLPSIINKIQYESSA